MVVDIHRLTVELRKMEMRAKKKQEADQRKTPRPRKVGNIPTSDINMDDIEGLERSI